MSRRRSRPGVEYEGVLKEEGTAFAGGRGSGERKLAGASATKLRSSG